MLKSSSKFFMAQGIYVHFPFCRVHCSYCAFAVSTNDAMQDRYFAALEREIGERGRGEAADSVYFGGGTPSRTQPRHLAAIASRIREHFRIEPEAEFSIEANPEDVSPEAIGEWQSLGVNRLSIGVQSFHDEELRPLGRVHGRDLAMRAVKTAVASGVRTSLDLILGLPGQTAASFDETLKIAIDLGSGHISIYMLDLEAGSVLERQVHGGRVELPDDDLVAQLYVDAIARLRESGFAQYEISNFAREGEESRHNLHYWRREQYYGFGLGAHSFLDGRRFANTRDLARYVEAPGVAEFTEELSEVEEKRETIFLRLRQPSGLEYGEIVRLCGQEGIEWIEQGVSEGWLRREGERVAFTPSGFLLSTDLISQLF
jgi:oxygen-independent coproporphyrinogen-3 oxidase